ncbi:D-alanyl-D-alanine carboxypeptidase family protein [Ahrensia marina]|uniref:D-alanyl-D-alanine carboxypeptidase family protein n=1 Tax=Ahrensia marina TaxID=1514904 RepID=UPI0006B63557|nr:D-alanyl-D-alanine carboxypeptidase family protein [Ahrensia marina]
MLTSRRAILALIIPTLAYFMASIAAFAAYEPPRSALVIDVGKNQTLFEDSASAIRHPASLTKMMTLYLVFEALESGKIKLDTGVVASRHSADRPPSRLGHSMGEVIPVDLAIDALVVRSANDVAAAIAEMLAGSEEAFAAKMTAKARELGMKDTVYKNASGLPDKEQVTTARDQAILGIALKRDFPTHFPRFSIPSVSYKDRTWETHNNLLGKVKTVTGIKTGFINASGFNVVTYSEEISGDKIVVVMGGRSAKERDQIAMDILEGRKPIYQLSKDQLIARNAADKKEQIAAAKAKAAEQEAAQKIADKISTALVIAAVETKDQATREPADITASVEKQADEIQELALADAAPALASEPQAIAKAMADTPPATSEPADDPISRYAIQVGALPSQERAMERLTLARPALASTANALRQYTVPLETSRGMVYRARIIGFSSMQDAFDACSLMEAKKIECMALIQK